MFGLEVASYPRGADDALALGKNTKSYKKAMLYVLENERKTNLVKIRMFAFLEALNDFKEASDFNEVKVSEETAKFMYGYASSKVDEIMASWKIKASEEGIGLEEYVNKNVNF